MNTKKLGYPLAMTTDAKKSKLKNMKPDAFLKKARKLAIGEGDRDIINKFKDDIKSGEPMGPLKLYADGSEDGRHRATAAKELDLDSVPVIDERTAKALGGALSSSDPNKFFSDIMKFSFAVLPLLRPGYLKEVPKQGFAHGGHVLEDDYPTHYLPEVGRQVMADGGSPEIGSSRFAALDPSMLVGTSASPFRGGEAYTDAGGQKIAAPFVSGMSGGYPVYDFDNAGKATANELPGGKNPFEDLLQFSWLSKLMGYADGGGVEGNVEFASPEVEQALKTAQEVADQRPFTEAAPEKAGEFGILPLRTEGEKVVFDPSAGSVTEFVKHALTPKISPVEIAKGAYEMGKGALEDISSAADYFKQTMTGQKPMDPTSDEAIKAAMDIAGTLTTGSFGATKPAGALAMGAARPAETEAYKRLVNPAGMYSRAHEVAMTELPETARTWQEMHSLLTKAPGVKKEELYWAGLHPETFPAGEKVSREQIANLIEKNFPQVEPQIRGMDPELRRLEQAHKESQLRYNQIDDAYEEARKKAGDDTSPLSSNLAIYHGNDPQGARESINKLSPELQPHAHALLDQIEEHQKIAANLNQVRDAQRNVPRPKYEQYTIPGGTDYEERILQHQYNPVRKDYIHPEVQQKYEQQYKEVLAAQEAALARYRVAEEAHDAETVQPWLKDLREKWVQKSMNEGNLSSVEDVAAALQRKREANDRINQAVSKYREATRENDTGSISALSREIDEARRAHSQAADEYQQIYENSEAGIRDVADNLSKDRLLREMGAYPEYNEIRAPSQRMQEAEAEYERFGEQRFGLKDKILEESKSYLKESPAYTKERYTHSHWDNTNNPVVHTRNSTRYGPEGEKIWHQEELQSDWAQEGREKGFQPEPLSSKEKKELDELMSRVGPESSPEDKARYQELSARDVGNITKSGVPRAPYTRDTEHWLELAAKDTLAQAIERGYDKIFITGGQEQAKRWANELRKSVDNVRWETPNPAAQERRIAELIQELSNNRDNFAQQMFARNYSELTASGQGQIDEMLRRAQKIPQIPAEVTASEGTKTVYFTRSGSGREGYLKVQPVEQPNGKIQYKVIDSDISKAKGESLSSVIGGDLAKRVMAEESGNVPMKGYVMGSEGYTQTYERKAPSVYKKLIKALDPEAKVETGRIGHKESLTPDEIANLNYKLTDEQSDAWEFPLHQIVEDMVTRDIPYAQAVKNHAPKDLAEYLAQQEGGAAGTYINITPKMREEYMRLKKKHGAVFPAYKRGGGLPPFKKGGKIDSALSLVRKLAGTPA